MPDPFEYVPDIVFVEYDPAEITNAIIGGFESAWLQDTGEPLKLYRPDARRMFLEYVAGIVIQQNAAINDTGRMNLLKYMRGKFLDGWGGNWGERGYRLPASRALTSLRFSIAAPTNVNVTIPYRTLVASTASTLVTFQTTELRNIPIGQSFVDVPAECTVDGVVGNDFIPGQVNRLVTFIPFAVTVANTEITAGGAEVQEDIPYRDALWALPESLSTCGPPGAYEWWAKQYSPAIIDVDVYSAPPIAGEVHMYPLLTGGTLPTAPFLADMLNFFTNEEQRIVPLTDEVYCEVPTVVEYNIDLDWYALESDTPILTSITAGVNQAIADFQLWTRSEVGRDIIAGELNRRILNAGAKRCFIREPIDAVTSPGSGELDHNEVGFADTVTVNFGGLEEKRLR